MRSFLQPITHSSFWILNWISSLTLLLGHTCSLLLLSSMDEYFKQSKAFIQITSQAFYCSMHKNGINLNVICEVCSLARRTFKTKFSFSFCDTVIWLFSSAEIDSAQSHAFSFITNGTMAFSVAAVRWKCICKIMPSSRELDGFTLFRNRWYLRVCVGRFSKFRRRKWRLP